MDQHFAPRFVVHMHACTWAWIRAVVLQSQQCSCDNGFHYSVDLSVNPVMGERRKVESSSQCALFDKIEEAT
jgi:hypothetical protein